LCKKYFAAYGGEREFFRSPFCPILLRKIGQNGDLKRILFDGDSRQMTAPGLFTQLQ
jgi:hypothetical protein